jgi:CheY-like chemotaxis protein
MLQRLIGEDIELVMLLGPDLGLIKADPTCMEQVLMNLAVNSRDAMPKGGKITVETANVAIAPGYSSRQGRIPAGEYVTLSFSDTGTGMTDEVKAHTFEPFFTTKEAGKGTGLGLATCQGIVRQSGGYIEVDSQLGRGTSFRIYLPRVEKAVANQPRVDEVEFDRRPQGTETILLVEDEAAVRTMLSKVLQGQGYTVFQAANGEEGLRLAQRCQVEKVDLLLTDVVMPQMSGTEMASQLRRMHPQIKVLLTSGYTDADIGQHDGLGADTPFIQKPFLPAALARKVREVLDK